MEMKLFIEIITPFAIITFYYINLIGFLYLIFKLGSWIAYKFNKSPDIALVKALHKPITPPKPIEQEIIPQVSIVCEEISPVVVNVPIDEPSEPIEPIEQVEPIEPKPESPKIKAYCVVCKMKTPLVDGVQEIKNTRLGNTVFYRGKCPNGHNIVVMCGKAGY